MNETMQTYLLTWRQRTRLNGLRSGWTARQTQVQLTPGMAASADAQELAKRAAPDAEIVSEARLWAVHQSGS